MRSVLHLDVESYSEADLKRVGLYRYAEDLTTELNVVCYAFDDDPVRAWLPQALVPMAAIPPDALWQNGACPESIVNHIRSGGIVAAHNAQFERIVLNALGPQHGIPRLEIGQMRCTAAKAAAAGIPRNLGDAAKALGTHLKDDVGRVNMLALSRPRTGKDKRYSMADYPLRWRDLIAYCMDDVRAERDLDRSLPDLSETEQRVYELDQVINDRGIRVDIPAVKATLALVNEHKANLEDAFRTQTGYEVTQTGKVADWVRSHGYPQLPDLQAASVIAALGDPDCPEDVRRVLAIRTTHAMKAVAKYEVMLDAVSAGDRLRGMLLYHGAGTGRWCLTGDHEVLTPAGWTRLDEWRGGSLFVCDEAGAGRFDEAVAQAFPYAGKLVEWDCERFAQRATPEHRMPVVGHLGGVPVSAVHTKMKIPRTVRTSESSRYSEAQIRFFVMAQADGHCSDDAWKFSFTKQRKVFRCRHILRLLALPFTERVYPNNAGKPRTVFEVRHSRSPAWTRALGPGKEFPWEMLYAHHDAFFDELERWDGYRCGPKSVQYSTISRHNADFVQAKAHLSGRQCNALTKDRTAEHPEWNVAYICNIWLSDAPASTRDLGRTETDFTGEVYCPATATGYFLVRRNGRCWITGNSSLLVQLQNLYRPAIKDQDVAIDAFTAGDLQWVKDLYGIEPMKVFASCIRGMLVPEEGKALLALDYAGIENRILPWMFGEEWKLAAFRAFDRGEGPDLYKLAYARAFGVKPEKVTDAQRQVGKVMELSLGYEGGVSAFATMAKTYRLDLVELTNLAMPAIPDETLYEAERAWQWAYEQSRAPTGMAKEVFLVCDSLKRLWRANHPAVVRGWKDMVDAAVAAVRRPGKVYCIPNKRIAFKKDGRWLWMRLPSGRKIGYFMPEVAEDGDGRQQLTYLGVDTKTRRWMRVPTYGGRITENADQAIARDILVRGMFNLDAAGYPLVLTVHDELVAEVPEGFGSVEEAVALACDAPAWAEGLPLAASGWRGKRYRK